MPPESSAADPSTDMSEVLEAALKRARGGTLSPDEWEQLWASEGECERALGEQSARAAQSGDFAQAAHASQMIADMNESLATIADVLASGDLGTGFDVEDLEAQREAAQHFSTGSQALSLFQLSIDQRIAANPAEAANSAEHARALYESLVLEGHEETNVYALMATWSEACRLASRALVEQFRLQYDDAALTFAQAKKVLEGAKAAASAIDRPDLLVGLGADIAAFGVARYQALMLEAFSAGNYEDALAHAESTVESSAAVGVSDELPPVQQQLTEIMRRQSVALLAYIRAEVAANKLDWSGAEQQLELARDEWLDGAELALNSGLRLGRQLAETAQASAAQVLGACRRRISRERSLYAQIDELKKQNHELQQRHTFSSKGDLVVTEQNAGRDINTAGRDNAGRDINTAGGNIDFSKVWEQHASEIDLQALAQELKTLRQSLESANDGTHDGEISAVAAAQVAASENDGPSALRWLKNAGKWVLDKAVEIGVPIAVTAGKAALGL